MIIIDLVTLTWFQIITLYQFGSCAGNLKTHGDNGKQHGEEEHADEKITHSSVELRWHYRTHTVWMQLGIDRLDQRRDDHVFIGLTAIPTNDDHNHAGHCTDIGS